MPSEPREDPVAFEVPVEVPVEDQLHQVFRDVDGWGAAPDLWERLEASLAADAVRRGRRRLVALGLAVVAAGLGVVAVGESVVGGVSFDWRVLEVVETLLMLAVVVGLRPLLDEVGRDFLLDVFHGAERTAAGFAGLLDLAWNLVFVGMVTMTIAWAPPTPVDAPVAEQVGHVAQRMAGLLLAMGVLHGTTFLALPFVGVVRTAATTGRPLPRWVWVLMAVIAVPVGVFLLNLLVGIVVGGAGG